MPRYVAFLRAINVGKRVVKMERLRQLFEELGFTEVESFINSGNIIFKSASKNEAALQKKVEAHLQRALGYEVATFLRTDAEIGRIAEHQPFGDEETLFIGFLTSAPNKSSADKLLSARDEMNDLHLNGRRELYWLCRTNLLESSLSGARLEKLLGTPVTLRNVNTVRRLAAKYPRRS